MTNEPLPFTTAWLTLALIPGLSPIDHYALLKTFGSPSYALSVGPSGWRQCLDAKGVATMTEALRGSGHRALDERVATHLEWLEAPDHHMLTLADDDYPPRLFETRNPPVTLFVCGDRTALRQPMLAIVGSRNASPQGRRNADSFADGLASAGLTIASGLAVGIDTAAHTGALAALGRDPTAGGTVAVIGTGCDRIYPNENTGLAERLIGPRCAIVSEFALGTPPLRDNFPRRNRLISGLSHGVLVIEAALASGSLITARLAAEQGREVFAIPGSIHSAVARGCHALLRQGASLVETIDDVLAELPPEFRRQRPSATPARSAANTDLPASGPLQLSPLQRRLLDELGGATLAIEVMALRLDLTLPDILTELMTLELAGVVARVPGGGYQQLYRSP
jgi:DNA processing protein